MGRRHDGRPRTSTGRLTGVEADGRSRDRQAVHSLLTRRSPLSWDVMPTTSMVREARRAPITMRGAHSAPMRTRTRSATAPFASLADRLGRSISSTLFRV